MGDGGLLSLTSQLLAAAVIFFACEVASALGVLFTVAFGTVTCLLSRRADAALCKSPGLHALCGHHRGTARHARNRSSRFHAFLQEARAGVADDGRARQQILDGLGLASRSPLLGSGPDEWRHTYREVQSAQYMASAIHCGYLQLALDAGVMSLLAFLSVAVPAMWGLCRTTRLSSEGQQPSGDEVEGGCRAWGPLVSTGVLLAHALIDIDFQFGLILVLLALFLGEGLSWASTGRAPVRSFVAPCLLLVALLGTVACWAGGARASALARLAGAEDSLTVDALVAEPLAAGDVGCQTEALRAYYNLGEPETATMFAKLRELPRDGEQALIIATMSPATGAPRGLCLRVLRMSLSMLSCMMPWRSCSTPMGYPRTRLCDTMKSPIVPTVSRAGAWRRCSPIRRRFPGLIDFCYCLANVSRFEGASRRRNAPIRGLCKRKKEIVK